MSEGACKDDQSDDQRDAQIQKAPNHYDLTAANDQMSEGACNDEQSNDQSDDQEVTLSYKTVPTTDDIITYTKKLSKNRQEANHKDEDHWVKGNAGKDQKDGQQARSKHWSNGKWRTTRQIKSVTQTTNTQDDAKQDKAMRGQKQAKGAAKIEKASQNRDCCDDAKRTKGHKK